MSNGHQTETLDIHMNESNWRKLIGMVLSLIKKYKKAVDGLVVTTEAFDEINASASTANVRAWLTIKKKAQGDWHIDPQSMDVYDTMIKKAPTKAEMQHDLSQKENSANAGVIWGSTSWIASGLRIQETQ
ncbi:hypothetical protein JAAARDRAFT_139970 [Jaapia argillacea MUCL 33604]|uniref:Uncharacterized protein n=1 Tax=Jaapia argillacea MUCL 33604 TaxID=933084 RepID=A0A067PMG7_9AGAM|nr:hypothetical protein JAAARDRAFT_139970 [Jaapia argillacea MUCL 33604]